MSFFQPRKVERSYNLLSSCAWYTPDVAGLFAVLGWFLVGGILAGIVGSMFNLLGGFPVYYSMLVMYPLMFLPLLVFVRLKSMRNSTFDRGYALDSNHFGSRGGLFLAVAVIVGVIAVVVMMDLVNHYLPDTEGSIIDQIEKMMEGPLWVNILTMCIMAPLFEEWMCRGVLLRGLLNYEHKNPRPGETRKRGMSPALAIVISSIFFAAIHGNIWQGVGAFALGCLFGYVYYRTGSLKLTVLMHFANNFGSVMISKFTDASMSDTLIGSIPDWEYAIFFVASALLLSLLVRYLKSIGMEDPQGNCDIIPSAEDQVA